MGLSSMPPGAKVGAAAAGGGAVMASLYQLTRFLPPGLFYFVIIGTVVVGVLTGLFAWFIKRRRQKKARPMEQQLKDNSAATPQGVTEPGRRARLDDLRKNFEGGVEKFRAAGKNIYSVPWYALVGEPGSGKTEAIRHCNVGFPPGLQDQLQGVGGTINMNWWFTNHAVILDTAGRLMFEEVEPGATSEWREFLKLLRANRPNCPINGMLLVIPADSLIRDTADDLERKGARIAQQLDQIQRALGVRFPVFVVVSKCDLINGFREFFEDITDPQLQHQMLGWSNPASLDDSFNPELVSEHLQTVVQRLTRRRLGLLLDPVNTEDPNARRTDQVDALYAFPKSLAAIGPRLRRYLEMIFVAGEWSAKPLFLRGIYFTSSMREGSALDAELAEVLGVPVESLPEGKVWERERAYFLRDLFMNKVFREKGLVTNATNAKKRQRWRKGVVLATAFLAVLVFSFFTWWFYSDFKATVGGEARFWLAAAHKKNWEEDNTWQPIVYREGEGDPYSYTGQTPWPPKEAADYVADQLGGTVPASATIVAFHRDAMGRVGKNMPIPKIYRLAATLSANLDADRRRAQRILYECSVVRPLIDAARRKMAATAEEGHEAWSPDATAALGELIRLEAQNVVGAGGKQIDANALFRYVLKEQKEFDVYHEKGRAPLDEVLAWTYGEEPGGGSGQPWPPQAVAPAARGATAVVDKGLDQFVAYWGAGGGVKAGKVLQAISVLAKTIGEFGDAEKELLTVGDVFAAELAEPRRLDTLNEIAGRWTKRLTLVSAQADKIEQAVIDADLAEKTLVDLHEETIRQKVEKARGPHDRLVAAARPGGQPTVIVETDSDAVKARKRRLEDDVVKKVEASLSNLGKELTKSDLRGELVALDANYLDPVDVDEALRKWVGQKLLRLYALRLRMYQDANAELVQQEQIPGMEKLAAAVTGVRDDIDQAERRLEQLGSLAKRGFRVQKAGEVSRFVTDRLARRRRIHALLTGVLTGAPKTASAVAAKVTEAAKDLKPIPRPVIFGTGYSKRDASFDPRYHRHAAAATFAGWKTIERYVDPPADANTPTDVIDRKALETLYGESRKAYTDYLEQYQEHWRKTALNDLACTAKTWKQFQDNLEGVKFRDVGISLELLGKAMMASLTEVRPAVPRDSQAAHEATVTSLRDELARMGTDGYKASWADWLGRWKALGTDVERARRALLGLTPTAFLDKHMADVDARAGISQRYWRELSSTGLKTLAEAVDDRVRQSYDALALYARFPLAGPAAGGQELTAAEIDRARAALKTVRGALGSYGEQTIGGGQRTAKYTEINRRLDLLAGAGLPEAKRSHCDRIGEVLEALPKAGERFTCTVHIPAKQKQDELCAGRPSAVGPWQTIRLEQGGTKFADNLRPGGKLGTVMYPGEDIVVKFFLVPRDQTIDNVSDKVTIPGLWAAIRAIHGPGAKPNAATRDGRRWYIRLTATDRMQKQHWLWLELEFEKKLPNPLGR